MGIALWLPVTKPVLRCFLLVLCVFCRVALAQGGEQPSENTAAPPAGVNAPPRQREEAPRASSQGNDEEKMDDFAVRGGHEPPRPLAPPETSKSRERTWYGAQVLTADALSFAIVALGAGVAGSDSDSGNGLAEAGLATYLIAPPVIHLLHGRPGMAPASLGIRIALPILGLVLGNAAQNCDPRQRTADTGICSGPGWAIGLLAGVAAASAVDAAAFSWDNPQRDTAGGASFGVTPVLSADGKRGELLAFGTF
jgi:hypothetical protein